MAKRPTSMGIYDPMSQVPEPFPPPTEWTDKGEWHNPAGTVPFPSPTNMPVGVWNGPPTMLQWQAGAAPIVRRCTWRSPVFDLRPEQRASRGQVGNSGTLPIWKPSTVTGGAGGRMWVQIGDFGNQVVPMDSMEILMRERAHIQDPNNMAVTCTDEDITDKYVPGNQDVLLTFAPPGEGYPVRFYQLVLIFNIYDVLASDPVLRIEGAYY